MLLGVSQNVASCETLWKFQLEKFKCDRDYESSYPQNIVFLITNQNSHKQFTFWAPLVSLDEWKK